MAQLNPPIDPELLISSVPAVSMIPTRSDAGIRESSSDYIRRLENCRKKQPLQEACTASGIQYSASWNLSRLRQALLDVWYPSLHTSAAVMSQHVRTSVPASVSTDMSFETASAAPVVLQSSPGPSISLSRAQAPALSFSKLADVDDAALVNEYGAGIGAAAELLTFDRDGLESEDEDAEDSNSESRGSSLGSMAGSRMDPRLRILRGSDLGSVLDGCTIPPWIRRGSNL